MGDAFLRRISIMEVISDSKSLCCIITYEDVGRLVYDRRLSHLVVYVNSTSLGLL